MEIHQHTEMRQTPMPDRSASRIVFAVLDMIEASGHPRITVSQPDMETDRDRCIEATIVLVEAMLREDEIDPF